MPNKLVQAAAEGSPSLSRRLFIGGAAIATLPVAAVASPARKVSLDEFLAVATPAELVRYHVNALTDAMAAMHPDGLWRNQVDHECKFVLVASKLGRGI